MAGFGVWLGGLLGKMRTRPIDPQFAEDNNAFALAMYGKLRQQPGNLFFSPFSIRTALAMTQAGAKGETATQMREALCISSSDETLHVACDLVLQHGSAAPEAVAREVARRHACGGRG